MQTVTAGRTYSVVPIEMGATAVKAPRSIHNEKAEALDLGPFNLPSTIDPRLAGRLFFRLS